MKLSKLWLSAVLCTSLAQAESFVVQDVRVDGLQRITAGSFFNYLPVKRGDKLDDSDFSGIIRKLYQTEFFENINLLRDGNTLVVKVQERPVIGKINLEGNRHIKSKDLLKGLVVSGLGEGDTFSTAKLNKVEQELLNLYYSRSKFDVIIQADTTPLDAGRVALNIDIQEGISARIKQINLVGNKAFSEKELLEKLKLSTSKWHSMFTRGDQYSGEKLSADIDALETFYLNRGFINFKINSTQVSLTDDKKDVYITINITEGLPYRIAETGFSKVDMISQEALNDKLSYRVGDYYSRDAVRRSQTAIKEALGDLGYAFANVQMIPKVDNNRQEITLQFAINPGRRTYVRRVEFTGNYSTNDEVLRREMRQMEASVYNHTKLERSRQRLQRLGYISSVKRMERSVSGQPDQVDVMYEVVETPNRSISAGIGYGSSSGVLFNLGYNTANFMGTGNHFSFDFSNSASERSYAMDFTDPYFTANGISRSFSLYYNEIDEKETDIGDWASDNWGAFLRFGFPVNEYESFKIGGGYRGTKIKTGNKVTPEIPAWLDKHGKKFDEYVLDFNWTHDTRDSTVFANTGAVSRFNAEVVTPGSTETYYKIGLRNRSYFKLHDKLITSIRGDVSYGDGYGDTEGLPFFRHYYAGGLTTVRGFQSNSLGPRWSNNDIKGGNLRVTGGAEVILPWYMGQDKETVRFGAFTDFGNVYESSDKFDVSDFRYSAGLFLLWRSPVGPLNISYGVPLNEKAGDKLERFQFTIGVPL